MENKISRKYVKLEDELNGLPTKSITLIGIMSMARTINILKIISKEKGFEKINRLQEAIDIILDIILFDKREKINELDSSCEICTDVILALEAYENSSGNYIMDCSYELIEAWYYFTDFDYCNINEVVGTSMRKFIIIGGEIIQGYLNAKYSGMEEQKKNKVLEKSIILENELNRIDTDIAFVKSNISNDKMIKKIIKDYEKINILL